MYDMDMILFVALISLCYGLRLEKIRVKQIWGKLIFKERIGTLLHSVNLNRSRSKLAKILLNRRFPSWHVYDSTCETLMDERRYVQVQRACLVKPQLWSVFASPACISATRKNFGIVRTFDYFRLYPLSHLLAKNDLKPLLGDLGSYNLELEKILRLALYHLDNCIWIRATAKSIDFETDVDVVWDMWDRFHPRCFLQENMQSTAIFFLQGVTDLSLADCDELARLFIKITNLYYMTDDTTYSGKYQLSQAIAKLMNALIDYMKQMEIKPQWVEKVVKCIVPHIGRERRVGLWIDFPVEELLRAAYGGIQDETARDHWTVQISQLCYRITGSLHHILRVNIDSALKNTYLWPMDLLDIYELEQQTEIIPSQELSQRMKEPRAKPGALQKIIMKKCQDGCPSFFDRVLAGFIPIEMRLSHLVMLNAEFTLERPVEDEGSWSASLLRVSMDEYAGDALNIDDFVRVGFKWLLNNGAIEAIISEPTDENPTPAVQGVIRLVDWRSMQYLGFLLGICTLYSRKLPLHFINERQLLVATGYSSVTISPYSTSIRDFEQDRITPETKTKIRDLAQNLRYCQEAYWSTVQGFKLIEQDELIRLLQPS